LHEQPASFDSVITVSATDANDALASFSNFGPKIDVAAPGVYVLSLLADNSYFKQHYPQYTYKEKYLIISGTSMASPQVAGVVAVVRSEHPEYGVEEIRQVLRMSADDKGNLDFDTQFGYGRVNLEKAVSIQGEVPTSDIQSLQNYEVVQGSVTLQGIVKGSEKSYSFRYKKNGTEIWHLLIEEPVTQASVTYALDSNTLADGYYYLKLESVSFDGNKAQDIVYIGINNVKNTYTVDDDGLADFKTVQDAVDNAATGDEIMIMPGVYNEEVKVQRGVCNTGGR
jgi:hypothetical protein